MANRFRVRETSRNRGTVIYDDGSIFFDSRPLSMDESCNDVVGAGDNWEFDLNRTTWAGGELSTGGSSDRTFDRYMVTGFSQFTKIVSFPAQKPYGTYATEAAARTSPSRPYVDVPVSVLELGDIAHLIRDQGNNLIKQFGGKYLEAKFFWEPLLSDLYKLTLFHEQANRRADELKKLQGATGLRKTVMCDHLTVSKPITWDPQSVHVNLPSQPETIIGSREIKCHCRWVPTADLSKFSTAHQARLVRRAMLGLTVDISTLWELLPFSWLIDWGFNVSAFLKANRNMIPAQLDSCSIIERTTSTATFSGKVHGPHYMSSGVWQHERKRRFRQAAIPVAHFPFLTGSQMGIVAALAVTRA